MNCFVYRYIPTYVCIYVYTVFVFIKGLNELFRSDTAATSSTSARLEVNFGQRGPNFSPSWTNGPNFGPAWFQDGATWPQWTYLGATSTQVEVAKYAFGRSPIRNLQNVRFHWYLPHFLLSMKLCLEQCSPCCVLV